MNEIVSAYTSLLKEHGENGEKYKWDAIEHFRQNWDIDAPDFKAMFKEAFRLRKNLFYQNSWGFITKAVDHFPSEVKKMFVDLYNETQPIETRILAFQDSAAEMLPKVKKASGKQKLKAQQDERTLSVYLSFRFPEKYFIYMDTFYSNYCAAMNIPIANVGKKYLHYLKLAETIRDNYLRDDSELKKLHQAIFPETTWNQLNLQTQNIFFSLFIDENLMDQLESKSTIGVVMVNITWNSNNWQAPSDDPSNHAWVKDGNIPHESWNFDFDNPRNTEGKIFGHAQFTNPPKLTGDNNLIVFHSKGQIVGFYGQGELLSESVPVNELESYNLVGNAALSVGLTNKIEQAKEKGYFEDKSRMGQVGFIYLKKKETITRMLDEAARLNPDQKETIAAIKNWFLSNNTQSQKSMQSAQIKLNQILFGPPGTGKTYQTINEAVKITDPEFYKANKDNRAQIKKRFRELLISDWDNPKGQIAFCTFHQSFSYEDFMEGIKPLKPKDDDMAIKYDVVPGIFKNICRLSQDDVIASELKSNPLLSMSETEFTQAKFYKLSLGDINDPADDEIYEYCIKNNCVSVGFGGGFDFSGLSESKITEKCTELKLDAFHAQALNYFIHYLKNGNYVVISKGNSYVRALGKIKGPYRFEAESSTRHSNFRDVEWIFTDENIPVNEIYDRKLSQMTIYKLDEKGIKSDFFVKSGKQVLDLFPKQEKRYVLIIDEINRGNIASIFGELITLIEPDKRDGADEQLEVILPYSKEPFKVPENVHLIGTMNTADRSVEALDTALRRRFSFKEIAPISDILKQTGALAPDGRIGAIDVIKMLNAINYRIEKLIDKDHKIGHAYFLKIERSEEALKQVFADKIIPLLEEYFFGDLGKIGLVLGQSFVEKVSASEFDLANFSAYGELVTDLKERAIFRITPKESWDFISIYQ